MSSSPAPEEGRLNPETHARIFAEKLFPDSGILKASSQVQPKAIILAGQPGAGKGGLVNKAEAEFAFNVVTVDPDDLRMFHPEVKRFQTSYPLNWSGYTHPDASQWANELREAAIEQKKNLIIDTTLGNGDRAVAMIKDLEANGYEVQVRAMATHRLESEVGVDRRFTSSVDKVGYGRYVPSKVREDVYDSLPRSLDTVHSQTNVPIAIFNRKGDKLYDSQSDPRQPGLALSEARDQSLNRFNKVRELRDDYRAQLAWHQDLPHALERSTKVPVEAHVPFLRERESLRVVSHLASDAAHAEQAYHAVTRRIAGQGLGALGVVATVVELDQTRQRSVELLDQGNVTGAQSGVLHFGSRTLGMATGAAVAGSAGALVGVESGPGAFATGTVGGIAGAVAGDAIADAIDNYRIYHQTDPQGLPWRSDPDHPEQGWVSEIPPLPNGPPPVADAALQDRLDYQSSSTSAELRMAVPGKLADPYKQPAGPGDQTYLQSQAWTRNSDTHAWSRDVTTAMVDRTMLHKTEFASTTRAAELDRAAEETIGRNRANSPQGVADTYRMMYAHRGWEKFGPMPEAVTSTLKEAHRTVLASDGHTYTQGADRQWSTPGMLYGRNEARGNILDEVNATQRLDKALRSVEPAAPSLPVRLDGPSHPDHAFYMNTREKVHDLDRQLGREPDYHSDQLASALTVQARAGGFQGIDEVALATDNSKFFAVHRSPGRTDNLFNQYTELPTAAASQSMEESAAQWPSAMQQFQRVQEAHQAQSQAFEQARQQAQQQEGHGFSMIR